MCWAYNGTEGGVSQMEPVLPTPLASFAPIEVDCATTVMLKILDGKCKMSGDEKNVMAALYQALKNQPGNVLDPGLHTTIENALRERALASDLDEALRAEIYELRLLAETQISRPVMKDFKAKLRQIGILPQDKS